MHVPVSTKHTCLLFIWRPITISSTFSKVLESLLESYSDHHFHDLQFGFVTGRSTDMATTLLNDVVTYCKDGGSRPTVYTCSPDAEGAFDVIPHSIRFQKALGVLPDHCWHIMINDWYSNLNVQIKWCGKNSTQINMESYGIRGNRIRGNILKLIESYLANRQQFVTINNSNSTQKTITCGVPQGSILGPLFFLLYINNLPNVSEKLFAILFADDTSVFLEGKDLAEITNTLNAEHAKLTVWLSANKLTLNTSKSHFMIFHRAKLKSSDTNIPVILSNTILEQVTFIKFLGVIIDNKLTFERHIVYTKNKILRV